MATINRILPFLLWPESSIFQLKMRSHCYRIVVSQFRILLYPFWILCLKEFKLFHLSLSLIHVVMILCRIPCQMPIIKYISINWNIEKKTTRYNDSRQQRKWWVEVANKINQKKNNVYRAFNSTRQWEWQKPRITQKRNGKQMSCFFSMFIFALGKCFIGPSTNEQQEWKYYYVLYCVRRINVLRSAYFSSPCFPSLFRHETPNSADESRRTTFSEIIQERLHPEKKK